MDKLPPDHLERFKTDLVYRNNFLKSNFEKARKNKEQIRKDKSIEMCEIFNFVVNDLEKKGYYRSDSGFLSAAAILTSSVFQSED